MLRNCGMQLHSEVLLGDYIRVAMNLDGRALPRSSRSVECELNFSSRSFVLVLPLYHRFILFSIDVRYLRGFACVEVVPLCERVILHSFVFRFSRFFCSRARMFPKARAISLLVV